MKLVTSSGAVINAPNCSQLVITTTKVEVEEISYPKVIEYFITERFPMNIYWEERQFPEGIQSTEFLWIYRGRIGAHLNGNITEIRSKLFLINGTVSPRKEWIAGFGDLLSLIYGLVIEVNYAPSFILDAGPGNMRVTSVEAGDYVALLVNVSGTPKIGDDPYGFYEMSGQFFEYPESLFEDVGEFNVKTLLLNIAYKHNDSDSYTIEDINVDPLKYILVNSGYDFLIVGVQAGSFDPNDIGWDRFQYKGKIYVNPDEIPSNPENSEITIEFTLNGTRLEGLVYYDNSSYLLAKVYAEDTTRSSGWFGLIDEDINSISCFDYVRVYGSSTVVINGVRAGMVIKLIKPGGEVYRQYEVIDSRLQNITLIFSDVQFPLKNWIIEIS